MDRTISGKFDLNGWPVWYEKFGTGHEVVLLIPGAMGTGRSDFKEQLDGPNAFNLKKYTFVAIELPGWGRSRPPKRSYDMEVYNRDADCAFNLMSNLGYKNFSIISWSEGSKVALLMCYTNPNRIKCAVAMAVLIQATRQSLAPMLITRDMRIWPKEQYECLLQIYGNGDTIQLIWDQHINFIKDAMNDKYGKDKYIVTPEQLRKIRCSVLLVHGDKDPLLSVDQVLFCKTLIPEAVIHRFPDGSHNCHQVFAQQFKRIVENFFDNCDNCF